MLKRLDRNMLECQLMITTESQPVTISPADWVLPFASGDLSPAEVEALLLECEADHA